MLTVLQLIPPALNGDIASVSAINLEMWNAGGWETLFVGLEVEQEEGEGEVVGQMEEVPNQRRVTVAEERNLLEEERSLEVEEDLMHPPV